MLLCRCHLGVDLWSFAVNSLEGMICDDQIVIEIEFPFDYVSPRSATNKNKNNLK